jgi:hypothetical protein
VDGKIRPGTSHDAPGRVRFDDASRSDVAQSGGEGGVMEDVADLAQARGLGAQCPFG